MTSGERSELALLYDFVKEWRKDDAQWKQLHGVEHDKQDDRINALEDKQIAAEAVAKEVADRTLSRRAKVAIALSAGFSLASLLSTWVLRIAGL